MWTNLGNVLLSLHTGLNPRRFFKLNTADAQNYYVTIRELKNGRIVFSPRTDRINDLAMGLCNRRSKLEKGDVLFGGTGTIGATALVSETPLNWNIKEGVYALKPIQELLFPKYLLCLLQEQTIQKSYFARAVGGTVLSVPMKEMFSIEIPLPPLPEQRRIVSRFEELSSLSDSIDEDAAAFGTLARTAKSRILDLAIRGALVPQDSTDEPASVLLDRIRSTADKPPCPKNKKNVESEARNTFDCPFSIPESWTWTTLQEISSYRLGKTPPRGQAIFWDHPTVPWVTISDMIDGGHITRTREAVSDYAIASGSAGQLAASGTLLLSFKLTIGKVSILDCPATHNEAIVSIKPIGDFDNLIRNYLFTILPKMVVFVKSSPAVMGNTLNKKSIGEIPIPLPPLAEQRRIVAKVDEMFETIDGMLG